VQGYAKQGTVVSIYPGVVYFPGDPIFFQSFNNHYILRRSDGVSIDGKYWGLSRTMYKSIAGRESTHYVDFCDVTWLNVTRGSFNFTQPVPNEPTQEDRLGVKNPLNMGQIINHASHNQESNVTYFEYTVPEEFPQELRTLIPNVQYRGLVDGRNFVKSMVLLCLRDIQDEELLADYNMVARSNEG